MIPNVSVVIVNWNTAQLLDRCLTSLFESTEGINLDVWVVDNASTDHSLEIARNRFPQVNLILNDKNEGFAFANNQAIRKAGGEYVLLLNTDAFLIPGTVRSMIATMEKYPDTGVLGCKLLYEDGSIQRSCLSFPNLATEIYQCFMLDKLFASSPIFGRYKMTYWGMNDFCEVDMVMGAVMLIRKKALDNVGLLDDAFFMYSEEMDLCYRMKRAGWKVRYTPDVEAVHLWGGSSRKVPAETVVRLYRSRVLFFRKYYGSTAAFLLKLILYMESIIRISGGYVAGKLFKKGSLLVTARNYQYLFPYVRAF